MLQVRCSLPSLRRVLWRRNMAAADSQSRRSFHKGVGRHRTRFQPISPARPQAFQELVGATGRQNSRNRGRIAKVGLVAMAAEVVAMAEMVMMVAMALAAPKKAEAHGRGTPVGSVVG